MKPLLSCFLVAALASGAEAQARAVPGTAYAPHLMSLATLDGFTTTGANWKIAGGATANRGQPLALVELPGTGVLVNHPSSDATARLLTTWEHGDLDLSLDLMLPRGSSAGLYLMGRYELQLADSWGGHNPTAADLGAIPQPGANHKNGAGPESFPGTPPRQNASRAPGLWQHVEILFRAPRFAGGVKVANARFLKVTVNGVVVQENVEVAGPTGDAAFRDERATGPLMIPGDHGPLAVRNVAYKSYTGAVALTALRYRAFDGEPMDSTYAATHAPLREGTASAFSADPAAAADKFALLYDGTMSVPTTGRYRFQFDLGWIGNDSATRGPRTGGGTLTIDGRPVLVHTGAERRAFADMELTAGPHPFVLAFHKNRPKFDRRDIAMWVEGPGVERQALHDESASGVSSLPVNPIFLEPQLEPVVLRSFVRHRGTKRVVAVSVADPLGIHFSYDLAQGALLYAWRGPFLETTQMWSGRGEDQTAEPMGSAITFPGTPSLAFLASASAAWPDSVDERQFRRDGYLLDKGARPIFLYQLRGVAVEDIIRPAPDGMSLRRELHLRAPAAMAAASDALYVELARGEQVTRDSDGSYVVGDRTFYITVPAGGAAPVVRRQGSHDELLVAVRFSRGEATVAYSVVW